MYALCTQALELTIRLYQLVLVLLVDIDDLLYFVITTHEDSRAIMNMFRDHGEHTFHTTVDRLAAS